MKKQTSLVVGASSNPARYAYKAVLRLRENQYQVEALGLKEGVIGDVSIRTGRPHFDDIHTITLYVRPEIQKTMYDYLLSLNPARIIFNPGTENNEFSSMAESKGIETLEACTLVLLSVKQY